MAETPPPLIPSPVDVMGWLMGEVDRVRSEIGIGATRDEVLDRLRDRLTSTAGAIVGFDEAIFNWVIAAVRSAVAGLNAPDVAAVVGRMTTEWEALRQALGIDSLYLIWTDIDKDFVSLVQLLPQLPFDVVAWVLTQVTGLTITGAQIRTLGTGSPTREDRIALGQILVTLYDETLPTEGVAAGFLARNAGTEEWTNFKMLSGAAMRLQLADLVLKWLGSRLPFGLGKGLSSIADLFNDAIALDDALEEVVQVPMQAVIQRGLEAQYNRLIKPADLSATEAFQARIAERITESDLGKILDNAGYRDDIRPILLDFAASNLTESDINDAYQRNLLSIEQVEEEYKNKFFQERERKIKTDLAKGTRRWQLQTKVVELLGNLYRDGVRTKDECRPYLNSLGFEDDEQELWFLQQELERQQRKWLSNAQVEDLLKEGLANIEWAIDYQILQGMLPEDATMVYTSFLLERFKKDLDEDCTKILKDAFTPAKLIGALLAKIPEFGVGGLLGKAELQKVLQCLLTNTVKAP